MAGPEAHISVETCALQGREDLVTGRAPIGREYVVTWRVYNAGAEPLRLLDAWVPHGRFRGQGHRPLTLEIPPGESRLLSLAVATAESPGTTVENAFLILRTDGFRLFARMRVEFDAEGAPHPVVESVTAQCLQ